MLVTSGYGFDVTEDGQSVVYSEGTVEYGLWVLDLADALKGNLSPERRLRSGTSQERIWLSPDGTRLLDREALATGVEGGSEIVLLPLGGGAELMHWAVDSLLDVRWMPDGQAFSYAERVAGRVRLVTVDARSGTRQNPVDVPDPGLWRFTPLSDGGWAWVSGRVHLWLEGDREARVLPLLKDEFVAYRLSAAPEQPRLASLVLNATSDSVFLDVTLLPEGQPTRWATFGGGQDAGVWWLADGSLVVWNQESDDQSALHRVRGPGRVERLGTIPRALQDLSLSQDGRRLVLVTQDSRGDVWLAHLKRTGGN